jgi:hypothetical protein
MNGRSVGGQIKEDDISSTFGMADKSSVLVGKRRKLLRERDDNITMGLKEIGS